MSEVKYLECCLQYSNFSDGFDEENWSLDNYNYGNDDSNEVDMLVKVVDDKVSDAIFCGEHDSQGCGYHDFLEKVDFITEIPVKRQIFKLCRREYINEDENHFCNDCDIDNRLDNVREIVAGNLADKGIAQKFIGEKLCHEENLISIENEINEESWNQCKIAENKLNFYIEKCCTAANIHEKRYRDKRDSKQDMLEYKRQELDRVTSDKKVRPSKYVSKQCVDDICARARAKKYERIIPEIIPYRALVQKLIQARKQY